MILVVDDDPDFLVLAERFLLRDNVMFASDARHAMALLTLLGEEEFSVALVDLNLPAESGFDLIPRLRSTFPRLPVIAITGYYPEDVLESTRALGVAETLTKPITREWKNVVNRVRAQRGADR